MTDAAFHGYDLNGTLVIGGAAELAARVGRETLVVCGAPRGKTSVVAHVLRRGGMFLGEDLHPLNHEDRAVRAVLPDTAPPAQLDSSAAFQALIAQRNAVHGRWAFKVPHALAYLPQLDRLLCRPVFVICLRNPLAVARSILAREPNFPRELSLGVAVGMQPFRFVAEELASLTAPTILIDMDAATATPRRFLKDLSAALALDLPVADLAAEIARPGYKTVGEPRGGLRD